jgi:hypothetical protein
VKHYEMSASSLRLSGRHWLGLAKEKSKTNQYIN